MRISLAPNISSVGTEGTFSGNFTLAKYLRGQSSGELERRIGYQPGRLSKGYWLLFALERPAPDHFEFGGYTYFSGARIGHPALGHSRPAVEQSLGASLGGDANLSAAKKRHVESLQLFGPDRLAKIVPLAAGQEYPVGSGIYQCNITIPLRCKVVAFINPGESYRGNYT
jgi:hypothetical protein